MESTFWISVTIWKSAGNKKIKKEKKNKTQRCNKLKDATTMPKPRGTRGETVAVNLVTQVLVGGQDLVTPKGHVSPHNKPNRSRHRSQKDSVASARERGSSCAGDSGNRRESRSDCFPITPDCFERRLLFQKAKKVADVNSNDRGEICCEEGSSYKTFHDTFNSEVVLIKCVYCFKHSETKAGNRRIPVSLCWCILRTAPIVRTHTHTQANANTHTQKTPHREDPRSSLLT